MRRFLLWTLVLSASLEGADAQTLRGTITDRVSGEPIASASVLVLNEDRTIRAGTVSDRRGTFSLRPTPGLFLLRVERTGYAAAGSTLLELSRADTANFEIRMIPQAVELDRLTVLAAPELSVDRSGFYRRRSIEPGRFLGPEDVERIRPVLVSDFLQGVPGFSLTQSPGGYRLLMTGRGRACSPTVYVDGMLRSRGTPSSRSAVSPEGLNLDALVQASAVRAVEIYRDGAMAPPGLHAVQEVGFVGPGDCGVIVFWTRYGLGT